MAQQESRVKKTLLNARVNLIFYFLTLCLSFFSRKIFLDCLGAGFVGLTGTLQNLLGFLNLAELGIGSAIGYVLYKPLFEKDQTKINEIISVMGYLYRWIGFIILGSGMILSLFLPLIFPDRDTGFEMPIIYLAYYAFLISSLIGYFINYRQNLLGADQRNYVVTGYFQTMNIIKILIQMAVASYTGSYYLWIIIELTFGILYSFILNWKINQTYPWLKADIRLGKDVFKKYPEVMRYTKQLFVHRISGFAQSQVSPILIYAFVSLESVAFYTNYTIIFDRIKLLIGNIMGSAEAGIGNLIAEGNKNKILGVFWELMSLRYFVSGITIFGLYSFTDSFISLWLGPQYILDDIILILLLTNLFLAMSRSSSDPFLFGSGMFYDTWAPVSEALIYIVVALIGGFKWGLPGVILGNTISLFCIIGIWKPYFLFSKGFKMPVLHYWLKWIKLTLIMIIIVYIINYAMRHFTPFELSKSWISLIFLSISWTLLFSVVYFSIIYISDRSFRIVVGRLCNTLLAKIGHGKK